MIEALVILGNLCLNPSRNILGICSFDRSKVPVVRYYEPGKSCYVDGTFYRKCNGAE
jgi:hypothetical protein